MTARYLLRLDDACHTMDLTKWDELSQLFDSHGIKPLVAVVPDNHDPDLVYTEPTALFWEIVRTWQSKGWAIAMHGHQHVMHQTKAKQILPFYERSEFSGLGYEQQAEKIRKSWQIFNLQGVTPTVWVAPAHCFDLLTLKAIKNETSIRIVSDGIARDQYYEEGFFWIPQQLWALANKKEGLWTVCLHPNTMNEKQIDFLKAQLEGPFSGKFTSLHDIEFSVRNKSFEDNLEDFLFWQRHRINTFKSKIRSLLRD